MFRVFAIVIAALTAGPLAAQTEVVSVETSSTGQVLPADGLDLTQFIWQNRVVLVFADTPADPAFQQQMAMLAGDPAALALRDVVIVTDTDPAAGSAARKQLRPRGFSLVWLDKDGEVRLRKPSPWSVRELTQAIDKTPLRIEEMLQRNPSGR